MVDIIFVDVFHANALSGLYLIGYTGVTVVGGMLRWKRLGSIKTYISGDINAPAHLFTGDWGHGIFFSALAK
jgi:hypothetical protein